MVIENAETLLYRRFHYHFVTLSLYFFGFLGLNMIEPHKPLIDSGLAVFLFPVSNKTAPKVKKNAPVKLGAVKINSTISVSRRWDKGRHFF